MTVDTATAIIWGFVAFVFLAAWLLSGFGTEPPDELADARKAREARLLAEAQAREDLGT